MIERYCDVCGDRMSRQDTQPTVKLTLRQMVIEAKIIRALNGTWNGGDICIRCIQKVVAEGEFQTAPHPGQQLGPVKEDGYGWRSALTPKDVQT